MATKKIEFMANKEQWDWESKKEHKLEYLSLKLFCLEGKMTHEMIREFLSNYNSENTIVIKIIPDLPLNLSSKIEISEVGSIVK